MYTFFFFGTLCRVILPKGKKPPRFIDLTTLSKIRDFQTKRIFHALLLVMKKITIEKKLSELGKNLDILRKNFQHFRILLCQEISQSVTHLQGHFMKSTLSLENDVCLESSLALYEVLFLLGSGKPGLTTVCA